MGLLGDTLDARVDVSEGLQGTVDQSLITEAEILDAFDYRAFDEFLEIETLVFCPHEIPQRSTRHTILHLPHQVTQ